MLYPAELNPTPSLLLLVVGGIAGTIILAALMFLAPALGLPSIDIPLLIGGIFTTQPVAAFWLGFAIFFFFGVLVFAPALGFAWVLLPGRGVGFVGATIKGLMWGAALWVLGGIALPLFGLLNGMEGVENPGLFAYRLGILGILGLLGGHLIYGVVIAVTTAMSRGIMPIDTIGWYGHGHGDNPGIGIEPRRRPGHDAPDEEPKAVRA